MSSTPGVLWLTPRSKPLVAFCWLPTPWGDRTRGDRTLMGIIRPSAPTREPHCWPKPSLGWSWVNSSSAFPFIYTSELSDLNTGVWWNNGGITIYNFHFTSSLLNNKKVAWQYTSLVSEEQNCSSASTWLQSSPFSGRNWRSPRAPGSGHDPQQTSVGICLYLHNRSQEGICSILTQSLFILNKQYLLASVSCISLLLPRCIW